MAKIRQWHDAKQSIILFLPKSKPYPQPIQWLWGNPAAALPRRWSGREFRGVAPSAPHHETNLSSSHRQTLPSSVAARPASSEKREATAAVVIGNGRKSRRSITVDHPPSIPARSPSPLFCRRAVVAASQSGYLHIVAAKEEESDWATTLF
ncbi:hypothetical protein MRB53_004888 [Persea americana]|uniref:Uncharacterized protein n=1 Tax=Persea americana TaxID=3435 RepID=A0ACC2MBV4_PERAE|nr:hypothetical protein MRB53_004888 [Persea americana]